MTTLDTLAAWVCDASLRATMIVLMVLLARQILRSWLTAKWKYALWFPVLVPLTVPTIPVLPGWMQGTIEPIAFLRTEPDTRASEIQSEDETVSSAFGRRSLTPQDSSFKDHKGPGSNDYLAGRNKASATFFSQGYWSFLPKVWLSGTVGFTVFTLISYHFTLRRFKQFAQRVDDRMLDRIASIARGIGVRRVPKVLSSGAVTSPAVCGVYSPTLLLNARSLRELNEEQVELVLRHELTHIKRGDLWLNSLLCLLLSIHWFNPLLWLAYFIVRNDREAACDDDVLRGQKFSKRQAYGNALLKLESAAESRLSLPFVGMFYSSFHLRERIRMIAYQREIGGFMKVNLILLVGFLAFLGVARSNGATPKGGDPKGGEVIAEPAQSETGPNGANSSDEETAGWGELAQGSGLRSRLTIETESPTVGKPLRFRLEVKNFGDKVTKIDPQRYAPFRVLRADFVDERPGGAPFIGGTPQTSASPVELNPGETRLLWERVDLNELFLITDEEVYDVYAEGGEWAMQTQWKDSNRIRIEIAKGQLQPEQQLLQHLLQLLPEGWKLSRSFGDINFHYAPSNLKKDAISIQLLFRDRSKVEQIQRQFANESVSVSRIGATQWGDAMLIIPNATADLWPSCREAISTALEKLRSPRR